MSLLLCLVLLQDADALIDKLVNGELAERDEAAAALVEMGPKALPALKKHAGHKDLEARARVLQAINDIERRQKVLGVKPPVKKVTLTLKDEPLERALATVMGAYGVATELDAPDKKVSLELKDAPAWVALETLRREAGVAPSASLTRMLGSPLKFTAADAESLRGTADLGDAGVIATVQKGKTRVTITLRTAFTPGSRPLKCAAEDVKVKVGGKDVKWTQADFFADEGVERRPGCLTYGTTWTGGIAVEDAGEAAELEVEGALSVTWPADLERHEFDLAALAGTMEKKIGSQHVQVHSATERGGRWKIEYGVRHSDDGADDALWWWLEDKDGAWIGDGAADGFMGSNSRSVMIIKSPGTPVKLVVAKPSGGDVTRKTFSVKIPIR